MLFLLVLLHFAGAEAAVSDWVPFDNSRGHISIPAKINGIDVRAMLDSGASGNGISEYFLEKHELDYRRGKRIILSGIGGKREVRLVNGLDFELFGTSLKMNDLMPLRLGGSELIIGLGFFDHFILQIDYPGNRLRIITHDSLDLRKVDNVKMKKAAGSNQPVVKVNMNDEVDFWLTLDTGNSTGIYLPRRNASRFDWLETFGTQESRVAGVNTVSAVERFNLPKVEVGPFTLENVIVIVPAEGETTTVGRSSRVPTGSRVRGTDSDGILGYDILKHFVVTIDFKRSLLHLEAP